jgi:hypothetical protein
MSAMFVHAITVCNVEGWQSRAAAQQLSKPQTARQYEQSITESDDKHIEIVNSNLILKIQCRRLRIARKREKLAFARSLSILSRSLTFSSSFLHLIFIVCR